MGKLRGEKGTPVTIKIMREGEEAPRDVTIVRDDIEVSSLRVVGSLDSLCFCYPPARGRHHGSKRREMLEFSSDPEVAADEMQAAIFYLTAFGYIDSDFEHTPDWSRTTVMVDRLISTFIVETRTATCSGPCMCAAEFRVIPADEG